MPTAPNSPGFDPAYVHDLMSGMNYEEGRVFLLLHLYQLENGSIPMDADRLIQICECSREDFNFAWPVVSKQFVDVRLGDIVDYHGDSPDQVALVIPELHRQRQAHYRNLTRSDA